MNNYQNPYGYMPYNFNYNQSMRQQPVQQPVQQQIDMYKPVGLQGKSVDSIDVVKAIDIPLDGSISYFPLADGTAIITKQLQMDGTSKTVIYKPSEDNSVPEIKYVTADELKEEINKLGDIKNIKRQIEDLSDDIEEINKKLKKKGE